MAGCNARHASSAASISSVTSRVSFERPSDIPFLLVLKKQQPFLCHAFEFACAELNIDHRLTKPRHPWTNGQVERMNRTIKDATVKRFHYENHDQLRQHLADFVAAYNFARRLKTLRGHLQSLDRRAVQVPP
jgi:transposase InsO family protein